MNVWFHVRWLLLVAFIGALFVATTTTGGDANHAPSVAVLSESSFETDPDLLWYKPRFLEAVSAKC